MRYLVQIYWPNPTTTNEQKVPNLNLVELLAGGSEQARKGILAKTREQGTRRSASPVDGKEEWQELDALHECVALWLGEMEKQQMKDIMESELAWIEDDRADNVHKQIGELLLTIQKSVGPEQKVKSILEPFRENKGRQRPSM